MFYSSLCNGAEKSGLEKRWIAPTRNGLTQAWESREQACHLGIVITTIRLSYQAICAVTMRQRYDKLLGLDLASVDAVPRCQSM